MDGSHNIRSVYENSNMICGPCQRIFKADVKFGRPHTLLNDNYKIKTYSNMNRANFPHHPSFQAFEKSTLNGCHLCLLFYDQIPFDTREVLRERIMEGRIEVSSAVMDEVSKYDIKLWYPFPLHARDAQGTPGFVMTLHMNPKASENTQYTVVATSPKTGFGSSWERAISWINECRLNHEMCNQPKKEARLLPSRLIAIGKLEDFSDVHLCATKTFDVDTRYVTLSHCWGTRPIIRLTTNSQSKFESSIPFHGLPKTFKEAIIATRNLPTDFNIRYLWIDSLCIVQDSRQDWHSESASMGRIYENSFLTLAATAGADGATGLFFERNPLSLRPCEVKVDWKRAQGAIFECENRMEWNSSVGRSPLVERSWVLQERLLSRRVLHFTANQLFWECLSQEASEVQPNGIPEGSSTLIKNWSLEEFKITRHPGSVWEVGTPNPYGIWGYIVRQYTRGDLSKPGDKLVAISGIAKLMQRHLGGGDEYVAGLWKRHLVHQLLWEVESKRVAQRPEEYRAPSWSWAATDGEIRQPYGDRNYQEERTQVATILSIEVFPKSGDPFLEIVSGSLRLAGLLSKAFYSTVKESARPMGRLVMNGKLIHEAVALLDLKLPDSNDRLVYCMPLFQWTHESNKQTYTKGLLLSPVAQKPGVYARGGVFHITSSEGSARFIRHARVSQLHEEEYVCLANTSADSAGAVEIIVV